MSKSGRIDLRNEWPGAGQKRIEQRTLKKLSGLDLATKRDGRVQAIKRIVASQREADFREPGTETTGQLLQAIRHSRIHKSSR